MDAFAITPAHLELSLVAFSRSKNKLTLSVVGALEPISIIAIPIVINHQAVPGNLSVNNGTQIVSFRCLELTFLTREDTGVEFTLEDEILVCHALDAVTVKLRIVEDASLDRVFVHKDTLSLHCLPFPVSGVFLHH
jgi:hypothetical protein